MSQLSPEVHPILSQEIVQALNAKRIFTILDFLDAEAPQIIKITQLTFKEVLTVRKFFLEKFSGFTRNGLDYYKNILSNCAIIPTGIRKVDRLLHGGILTGNIYEICGLPATGKTQFALTLVKNIVLNTNQNVYFLDSRRNFSALRMKDMIMSRKPDVETSQFEEIMKRILIKRLLTKNDLISSLYEIKSKLENGSIPFRFVAIDSLPILIWDSFDDTISERNLFLNLLSNILHILSVEHHVAFLITNLITYWTERDLTSSHSSETVERVACGKYWSTVPNTRLKIEKSNKNSTNVCTFSVLKSDNNTLEVGAKTSVKITSEGLMDVL